MLISNGLEDIAKIRKEIHDRTEAMRTDLARKNLLMTGIIAQAKTIIGKIKREEMRQRKYNAEHMTNLETLLVWSLSTVNNGFKPRIEDYPGNWAEKMHKSDGSGLPEGYYELFKQIYDAYKFYWELQGDGRR